jgi:hypothetical protein
MPARPAHHFGSHRAVAPGQKPLTVSPCRAAVTKPPGLEKLTTGKPGDLQEFSGEYCPATPTLREPTDVAERTLHY